MHIYAFGSICRGDVAVDSDVDLLAIVAGHNPNLSPEVFSIYSYERLKALWNEGNPFAWHLALESRLIFSFDQSDYLSSLGKPNRYKNYIFDCEKFFALFQKAYESIISQGRNRVFELSTLFLSIRNIATCFSLGVTTRPDFSRQSALRLDKNPAPLSGASYSTLLRARILSTRGIGARLENSEIDTVVNELPQIEAWMRGLLEKAKLYERIQQ